MEDELFEAEYKPTNSDEWVLLVEALNVFRQEFNLSFGEVIDLLESECVGGGE